MIIDVTTTINPVIIIIIIIIVIDIIGKICLQYFVALMCGPASEKFCITKSCLVPHNIVKKTTYKCLHWPF